MSPDYIYMRKIKGGDFVNVLQKNRAGLLYMDHGLGRV
jgi:hypothetical protein